MQRVRTIITAAILGAASLCPQVTPSFETASIKPSGDPETRSGYQTDNNRIAIQNKTLKDCIRLAYNVKVAQLSGGPKWVDTERFDIEARARGPADELRLMAMLQALLLERFKLQIHRETKMFPG